MKIELKKFLLLGGSLLIAGILGEAILQKQMPGATVFFVQKPNIKKEFIPELEIMPGIYGKSQYWTNAMGLRGDLPLSKGFNVLAIGGSTTEDLYLDQSEAWTGVLQKTLNNRVSHMKFWVGNAGKSGMDSRDHVLLMKHLPPQIKDLDLIIILIGINDLSRALKYIESAPPPPISQKTLYYRNFYLIAPKNAHLPFFKRTGYWQLGRKLKNRLIFEFTDKQKLTLGKYGRNIQRWRGHRKNAREIIDSLPNLKSSLEEYRENLNQIINLAKSYRTPLLFLTQPTMWDPTFPPQFKKFFWLGGIGNFQEEPGLPYYSISKLAETMVIFNNELKNVCQSRKIDFVDLVPFLKKDTTMFYDDCHFNELGAKTFGNEIANFMISAGKYF